MCKCYANSLIEIKSVVFESTDVVDVARAGL